MKAISLLQPWATLMAIGAKKVETRSWNTKYRGPLLIHASKGFPPDCRQLCSTEPFRQYVADWESLPRGAIIGIVNIKGTGPTDRFKTMQSGGGIHIPNLAQKMAFGDYSPGRYGWYCEDAVMFEKPIPYKGALSIWEFPDELLPEDLVTIPDCSKLNDRDLEGLICEKLLGWTEWQAPADASGDQDTRSMVLIESKTWLEDLFKQGFTLPRKGKIHRSYFCPSWCSSLDDALSLAGKVGLHLTTPLPRPRKIVEMAFLYGLHHKDKIRNGIQLFG